MRYSIQSVYEQASLDRNMAKLFGWGVYAYIGNGFKVSKDAETERIKIFLVAMGGEHYREISKDEYDILMSLGWKKGVVTINLNSYLRRISNAEGRMATELKRGNTKEVRNLEELIKFLTDKYERLKKQYNFTPLI